MWCNVVFANQFSPLSCAKSMLFIYHYQSQVFKLNSFLDQGMGADEYWNLSIRHPFQKLGAGYVGPRFRIYFGREFATTRTGEKSDVET